MRSAMNRGAPSSFRTVLAGGVIAGPGEARAGPCELVIRAGRIAAVRRPGRAAPVATVLDWRDRVVLPGLVNLHAHLEYTHLAHAIAGGTTFSAWVREIVAHKAASTEQVLVQARRRGAGWCLRTGTTTVLDIVSRTAGLPLEMERGPRLIEARELMDLPRGCDAQQQLDAARDWLARGSEGAGGRPRRAPWRGRALAPHSPYACSNLLLSGSARLAAESGAPWTLHLAESEEEWTAFERRQGGLWELGRAIRPEWGEGWCGRSPTAYVAGWLPPGGIVVHANYLAPGDPDLLAAKAATVVHCPLSHAFFGHAPFPYAALLRAGVRVVLATDSLATLPAGVEATRGYDLAAHAARFQRAHPGVAPADVLAMMTVAPAQALGRAGELGIVGEGTRADLFALPRRALGPRPEAWVAEWLEAGGEIGALATMVGGAVEWEAAE